MSLFKSFKTDDTLEQEGFLYDDGQFRCRLRRAGGHNKLYAKAWQKAMKPWRNRDIDKEDPSVRLDLLIRVFVESCYVEHSWETLVEGQWVKGIESEVGPVVPGSQANVLAVLKALPDVFRGLQREAEDLDNYLLVATQKAVEDLKDSSSGS